VVAGGEPQMGVRGMAVFVYLQGECSSREASKEKNFGAR